MGKSGAQSVTPVLPYTRHAGNVPGMNGMGKKKKSTEPTSETQWRDVWAAINDNHFRSSQAKHRHSGNMQHNIIHSEAFVRSTSALIITPPAALSQQSVRQRALPSSVY